MAILPVENWKLPLEGDKIWGIQPKYDKQWEWATPADTVLFYATSPVKGVIGYGTILSKMRDNKPIWPQEVKQGSALWPLRFTLDIEFCLALRDWETKRVRVSHREAVLQKGFQKIKEELARALMEALQSNS